MSKSTSVLYLPRIPFYIPNNECVPAFPPFQSIPCDPRSQPLLSAHYRVEGHPHINPIREVVSTPSRTYLLFPPADTDLHSYVRTRRRLKEPHARNLFAQIVSAVHEAHSKGIVLRDLKLRKFVFTSESR